MITDMLTNKKAINQIVTNLFIRNRKLNIPRDFITQFYFTLPKNSRLNYKNYFNIKIPQKWEFTKTLINYLSDVGFNDFMNLYKRYSEKQFYVLVNDTALA